MTFWITVLLYIVVQLLLLFTCEEHDIECPVEIHAPDLHDLSEFRKQNAVKYADSDGLLAMNEYYDAQYINNYISPAYHYFHIRDIALEKERNSSRGFAALAIDIALYFLVLRSSLSLNIEISNVWRHILVFLFCGALYCVLWWIYTTFWAAPSFGYSSEELRAIFERNEELDKKQYPDRVPLVSKENAFNNFVLIEHYHYLLRIKNRLIVQKHIDKALSIIAVLLYVLFIPQNP